MCSEYEQLTRVWGGDVQDMGSNSVWRVRDELAI